jgi:hypothetical protein
MIFDESRVDFPAMRFLEGKRREKKEAEVKLNGVQ